MAANLATSLKSENLPKIVEMLSSKDSGVRYWGAIGLLTQGEIGTKAGHAELLKALDDESLIVQVTAAEALGRYGPETDLEKVLAVLTKHCGPDSDPYLAIAAWNALDYLDDRAKSVSDQLRAISPKPNNPPNRAGDYSTALKNKTMADLRRRRSGRSKEKKPKGTTSNEPPPPRLAPEGAALDRLLTQIDQTELPDGYDVRNHQLYVDRRMEALKPEQRGRIGRLWKEKRRLQPKMQNAGITFVRILEYVATDEQPKKPHEGRNR